MFLFGLIIGLVVGTVFSAVIIKYFNRVKAVAKEVAHDVETEATKFKSKI
jgi:uncharacterized membrane-anchored protein YhcB (DUF1043 family)